MSAPAPAVEAVEKEEEAVLVREVLVKRASVKPVTETFFVTVTATTEIYTLSLPDAVPISSPEKVEEAASSVSDVSAETTEVAEVAEDPEAEPKSTRLDCRYR